MIVEHYSVLPPEYRKAVYNLLSDCEGEFVPPLSQRCSTRQIDLSTPKIISPPPAGESGGIDCYYQEMLKQAFLLSFYDGNKTCLTAFLSFIPGYMLPHRLLEAPSTYVSTVCTNKALRGKGIARELYTKLESVVLDDAISIRTWSTNTAQVHLLQSLGYRKVLSIRNDRGTGIDTVYYVKKVDTTHE